MQESCRHRHVGFAERLNMEEVTEGGGGSEVLAGCDNMIH